MKNFKSVIKYVFDNRRIIGVIVGSFMTLAGYEDAGRFIQVIGEAQ